MEWRGIVIGGLLPAVLYGVAGRAAEGVATHRRRDRSLPDLHRPERGRRRRGGNLGALRARDHRQGRLAGRRMGLAWGLGTWLVALGLSRYAVPVAKLAPLYNANTVVVVLLGLLLFAEYREVSLLRLAIGVLLVVTGATVVARA